MGIEVLLGRKVRAIIGSGLIFSTIISYSRYINDTNFLLNHSDAQLGAYFNAGVKLYLKNSYSIFFTIGADCDLIPLYNFEINEIINGKEMIMHENVKSYGFSINVGFLYGSRKKK